MTLQARRHRLQTAGRALWPLVRSALFRKYVVLIGALVGLTLITSSLVDVWFTARDHRVALMRIQSEQAGAAAARITQFIKEIEAQLGWMTHLPWPGASIEQRELDTLRLLRQVPAISEVMLLDDAGRERLRVSRQAMDRMESLADHSKDEQVKAAIAGKVHYGPVKFRHGSEPAMTLTLAGTRRDSGMILAEVNLTHIWDVIHTIRVGNRGRAYVVGPDGRLLAHPDISLVLRFTDMSSLEQVHAAQDAFAKNVPARAIVAPNIQGERMLTAFALAEPLKWMVFVELPEAEANEPLYASIWRSTIVTLVGIILALFAALALAQRMVVPIQALSASAAQIGSGALDQRISISSGDELEVLGDQFNEMAGRLHTSYSTLERKVDERTRELQDANLSKSRFLASASHDLRQPLHALNLLVAHLRSESDPHERVRLARRIDAAVANMNELFNALLDISKLEAGVLTPEISSIPLAAQLDRLEATFGPGAREKGLHFAVVPTTSWTRTDPVLLERILLNLVSNAVRYTLEGGIVVGCRRAGDRIRLDVCDTGIGIAADQQRTIFAEFYRGITHSARGDGLGLGLSIVERLSLMLHHPVEVASIPGKGSRFSLFLPAVAAEASMSAPQVDAAATFDLSRGKSILVIDDDALVRDSMRGLLDNWGFNTILAMSARDAIERRPKKIPDLIISDYRLQDGMGIEAIAQVRRSFGAHIPAFLISGDVSPALYEQARESGLHLLHKPLSPMALRAMIESRLKKRPEPLPA